MQSKCGIAQKGQKRQHQNKKYPAAQSEKCGVEQCAFETHTLAPRCDNDNHHENDGKLQRQIVSTREQKKIIFFFRYKRVFSFSTHKKSRRRAYISARHFCPAEITFNLQNVHAFNLQICHPSSVSFRWRSSCRRHRHRSPCYTVVVLITKISTYLANAHTTRVRMEYTRIR